MAELINPAPVVHERRAIRRRVQVGQAMRCLHACKPYCIYDAIDTARDALNLQRRALADDEDEREPIDALEVFEVGQGIGLACPHDWSDAAPEGRPAPPPPSLPAAASPARCATSLPLPFLPACLPACLQHIRDITDPEHPYTLEQLNVVSEEQVEVDDSLGAVKVGGRVVLAPHPTTRGGGLYGSRTQFPAPVRCPVSTRRAHASYPSEPAN